MRGIETLTEAFRDYPEDYVFIGGAACEFALLGTPINPRKTQDIDMVFHNRDSRSDFYRKFGAFLKEGEYYCRPKDMGKDGEKRYHLWRFDTLREDYPKQIELIAKHDEKLGDIIKKSTKEPIIKEDGTHSLSVSVLKEDNYNFLLHHSSVREGLSVADPIALLVLKAEAYLNLKDGDRSTAQFNPKNIHKHVEDIFRILLAHPNLDPIESPAEVCNTIHRFTEGVLPEDLEHSTKKIPLLPEQRTYMLQYLRDLFVQSKLEMDKKKKQSSGTSIKSGRKPGGRKPH